MRHVKAMGEIGLGGKHSSDREKLERQDKVFKFFLEFPSEAQLQFIHAAPIGITRSIRINLAISKVYVVSDLLLSSSAR